MPEEPIFDFSPLKDFLKQRGYIIGTRTAYEPFTPEDVKPIDITNGSMSFTDKGIFVKGEDGEERQVFLYKKDYHLEQYGKPRFHICKCETIESFINGGGFKDHYVRANSEPVPVIDLDNGRMHVKIEALPLCAYCRKMIQDFGKINSTDFVELLKTANDSSQDDFDDVETDIFGYTKDWEYVSKQYREAHHYVCEKCGLEITNSYDRQYMHVHHINGVKVNNRESNLKCLCLYCHAHVDENHRERLTQGAGKFAYDAFIKKYRHIAPWGDLPD